MNPFFYINVADLMKAPSPKCKLPKPKPKRKLKPTIIVNDGEWLQIIGVECEE